MTKRPETSPPVALSMGDPAGAGPHTAALAWRMHRERALPPFVFVGAPEAIEAFDRDIPLEEISDFSEAAKIFGRALPVIPIALKSRVVPGHPDPAHATAVIKALEAAAKAAATGQARALVTNPIYKKALLDAGFKHPGHTDYLGKLARAKPVMMLANDHLRAVPVTVHVPLKDAIKSLSKTLIVETAMIVEKDLKARFKIANPRLAVTGLNPHAGEEGALGKEEIKIIAPAIEALRERGIDVQGPLPADTAYSDSHRMKYDAFLAMTHDQALIPVKALDFRGAVNITLGLPFVRTSPAHGTAFDLIRDGRTPDPESLIQALLMADRLSR